MSAIIRNLERFNRKERFHVVHMAVADDTWPSKDSFLLSDSFRERLGATLGLVVPPDAFAAMDYHLDWIYAALYLALYKPDTEAPITQPPGNWLNSNQEDTDLLVAFDDSTGCHLVLVEAKGHTSWENEQMASKRDRLASVYAGAKLRDHPEVRLHYVLTSPRRPKKLKGCWPEWLDVGGSDGSCHWIEMPLEEHWRPMRCDRNGRASVDGTRWVVKKTPSSSAD